MRNKNQNLGLQRRTHVERHSPGMIGYGIAKAAVHHLVQDLAAPSSGIPERAKVAAICPYVVIYIVKEKLD